MKTPPFAPFADLTSLDSLASLGTNVARVPFIWEGYESTRGQYNVSYLNYYKSVIGVSSWSRLVITVMSCFPVNTFSSFFLMPPFPSSPLSPSLPSPPSPRPSSPSPSSPCPSSPCPSYPSSTLLERGCGCVEPHTALLHAMLVLGVLHKKCTHHMKMWRKCPIQCLVQLPDSFKSGSSIK